MTSTHFQTPIGRPVGLDEIEWRTELGVGVIDERGGRWIVDISPDAARCETCETTTCSHVDRIEAALTANGLGRAGAKGA